MPCRPFVVAVVCSAMFVFAHAAQADAFFIERAFDPKITLETGKSDRAVLELNLGGQRQRVLLQPNTVLERRIARLVPGVAAKRQRLYLGEIAGQAGSWVRLSRTDGLWEGALWDGHDMWNLTAARELPEAAATAGVSTGSIVYRGRHAWDRMDMRDDVRRTPLAPSAPARHAAAKGGGFELGLSIVVDTQFQALYGDEAARVASIVNIIDGYYAAANTDVYLHALRLLPAGNAGIVGTDTGALLDQLQDYVLTPAAPAFRAATHLISGKPGIGGGLAYFDILCNQEFSIGVSGGDVDIGTTAAIVAHELGHNYGAEHDGEPDTHAAGCPNNGFVMEPVITIGDPADSFSTCSLSRFAARAPTYACLAGTGGPDDLFSDSFEN
ncbi:M12 family metallo-peptidase [Chiayiivirga flava]|uniref:Peptidase M12B domain-containing protein n=1 Tax=Chiayiivirga flava TaxID=659595 RepID=A0A7W8G104_9GAMM|nr:M12 family metallo-peptidase [Chiayiivirga flava]MBB5208899.1 hypothetical protein [Chiayiivirga flava]